MNINNLYGIHRENKWQFYIADVYKKILNKEILPFD
jgi:hypothetical protein